MYAAVRSGSSFSNEPTSDASTRRAGSTSAGTHAVVSTSPSDQIARPTWSPTCGVVEPAAVVGHEVAHALAGVVGRVREECERPVEDRRPHLVARPALELQRDDCETSHVVDAVARIAIGDRAVRMLDDTAVVDERQQMVGAHLVELEPVVRDRCAPRRGRDRLAQNRRGLRGDRRPAERRADARRLGARGGKCLGLGDVRGDRSAELRSLAEADELAGAGGEHVGRVPVRRRDDRATGGERERERAGGALLSVRVRRDEDVGRREQVRELVDVEEAVVEHDVLGEIEVGDAPLQHQAVLLASAPRNLRMRAAGDHVENVGMLLDDRRQRVEHHLDSLAGREQAERREQEPRLDARVAAVGGRHVARPTTRRRARRARVRARSAHRAG